MPNALTAVYGLLVPSCSDVTAPPTEAHLGAAFGAQLHVPTVRHHYPRRLDDGGTGVGQLPTHVLYAVLRDEHGAVAESRTRTLTKTPTPAAESCS